jgi:predicted metalloprotease with PDZ domain
MLDEINKDFNFSLSKQNDGFGSSDYASFYTKNLPVLGFFTGLHNEYHKPADDVNLINSKDEEKILKFIYKTISVIDNNSVKPDFVKTSEPQQQSMTGFRVTLGVVPDYGETTDGMKISGVRKGGPAEKAGLLANDVIIKMGEYVIKNVYDYTYALGKFKPGDTTDVVVKRGTEEITFKIELKK